MCEQTITTEAIYKNKWICGKTKFDTSTNNLMTKINDDIAKVRSDIQFAIDFYHLSNKTPVTFEMIKRSESQLSMLIELKRSVEVIYNFYSDKCDIEITNVNDTIMTLDFPCDVDISYKSTLKEYLDDVGLVYDINLYNPLTHKELWHIKPKIKKVIGTKLIWNKEKLH